MIHKKELLEEIKSAAGSSSYKNIKKQGITIICNNQLEHG